MRKCLNRLPTWCTHWTAMPELGCHVAALCPCLTGAPCPGYTFCTRMKNGYSAMQSAHTSSSIPDDPRRQRILEAAYALLLSVGYDDTTTNAIAAATHLSKTTIYTWWTSKEVLFTEV